MYSAIGVEPTNDSASTCGCAISASTACLSPCTTLNTPSGRPASLSSSARRSAAEGSRSDGLSTKVLPQASATGNIQHGTIMGKLNGVMPATTPSGWRMLQLSMPPPIWSVYWPLSRCGMPQANSTTSMPRVTSPLASENTLPCSAVISAASSSWCSSSRALNLNRMRARLSGGVSDQAGNAAAAAATSVSTSCAEASGIELETSPVAGLKPCV
ncbi:Uncharacterised protein [Bordetella pertussis]|nr:Uncharacterised protein [Bordetella pertussis]